MNGRARTSSRAGPEPEPIGHDSVCFRVERKSEALVPINGLVRLRIVAAIGPLYLIRAERGADLFCSFESQIALGGCRGARRVPGAVHK